MTEVPNLSHADIQFIFGYVDASLNSILMYAFCKGVNTHSCNFSQFILTQILNRNLYWDYCYHNVDCLCVALTLNRNSCSYSDTVSAKDTNRSLSSHMMVFVILCLYIIDTLTFAYGWSFYQSGFIDNGQNFWTVFLAFYSITPRYERSGWVLAVSSAISTLIADTSMVC